MSVLNYKTIRSLEREKFWTAREFFLKPGVFKASNHAFRLGSKDDYYADLDYILNDPYQCGVVLDLYAQMIEDIKATASIDFLAFLDKASGGTVGAIRLAAALSIRTNIPNLTVRMGKAIAFEKVKVFLAHEGLGGQKGIVVSDHCTSGRESLLAADILRENGADIKQAVVYTVRPDKLELYKFKEADISLHYAYELPAYKKPPKTIDELNEIAVNFC